MRETYNGEDALPLQQDTEMYHATTHHHMLYAIQRV